MDITQLSRGERFALATALDDRKFSLQKDIERAQRADAGDREQKRRNEIIANIDSVREKLRPLLENVSDPLPGVSYKEAM